MLWFESLILTETSLSTLFIFHAILIYCEIQSFYRSMFLRNVIQKTEQKTHVMDTFACPDVTSDIAFRMQTYLSSQGRTVMYYENKRQSSITRCFGNDTKYAELWRKRFWVVSILCNSFPRSWKKEYVIADGWREAVVPFWLLSVCVYIDQN